MIGTINNFPKLLLSGSVVIAAIFMRENILEAQMRTPSPALARGMDSTIPTQSAAITQPEDTSCASDATTLCLNGSRFQVTTTWATSDGHTGSGQAVQLTPETGYFWFFDATNIEVVLKVIDACGYNQRFWVFAAGLTNVAVVTTVTDTLTGSVRTYSNKQGAAFAPIQDISAFATCQPTDFAPARAKEISRLPPSRARKASKGVTAKTASSLVCVGDDQTLCLNADRFRVQTNWRTADGHTGTGHAVSLTPDTGYFWFFDSSNVETVVKVLKGCDLNKNFWVFAAGLTNVEVDLTVTDVVTGMTHTYHNAQNVSFQPVLDTSALATCMPSCDTKHLTPAQVQAAVADSVSNAADPFGADLNLILNSFMAKEGCDLASSASSAARQESLPRKDCSRDYCSLVQYCGPGNSTQNYYLRLLIPSGTLNQACFNHDNCYSNHCYPNGCYFTQGLTATCDNALFDTCDQVLSRFGDCTVFDDCFICAIAISIYDRPRSSRPAKCQDPVFPDLSGEWTFTAVQDDPDFSPLPEPVTFDLVLDTSQEVVSGSATMTNTPGTYQPCLDSTLTGIYGLGNLGLSFCSFFPYGDTNYSASYNAYTTVAPGTCQQVQGRWGEPTNYPGIPPTDNLGYFIMTKKP